MRVKIIDRISNDFRLNRDKGLTGFQFAMRILLSIAISLFMSVLIEIGKLGFLGFFTSLTSLNIWVELLCCTAILSFVLVTTIFYIVIYKKEFPHYARKEVRISLFAMLVTFIVSMLCVLVFRTVLVMPLALSGLLMASLIGRRLGLIVNILLNQAFYICFIMLFGTEVVYQTSSALLTGIIGGTVLILIIPKNSSRIKYLLSGISVAVLMGIVGMVSSVIYNYDNWTNILIDGMWSCVSTFLAVALFMVIVPFFELVFNSTTNFRLTEISSFNSPLLKRLAKEAPGTFNHSILVADLAELCASAIGADSVLAKACGYYHDIGKLENPKAFIENQSDGVNPHDNYIPEVSVKLITNHATDGNRLIKEAKLPEIIADVCLEHHGTTAVNYFYYKVKSITESTVNKELFVYPGPKPQGKIAAIIMVVDTVEAATRSKEGEFENIADFRKFVHTLIKAKEEEGQFAECDLTTSDMAKIEDTLVETIPSISHKRIKYQ